MMEHPLPPQRMQQLMVGLPQTGKTTFLAALWHVIRSDELPDTLKLASVLHGDREYLNRIADQWASCQQLERTPASGQEVSILVREPLDGEVTELSIPDLSGETFSRQWEDRECSVDFRGKVAEARGILLFLHPESTRETATIDAGNEALAGWAENDAQDEDDLNEPSERPWEPSAAPTQVKMVELLQYLLDLAPGQLSIALIISAWDRITHDITPSEWLAARLPLLHQFLVGNASQFRVRVFGVSAQGGPLREPGPLLERVVASQRIQVITDVGRGHDITEPVRWLMSNVEISPIGRTRLSGTL